MKVVVEHSTDACYLYSPQEWTDDPAQAKVFPSSGEALLYCTAHGLRNFRIVMKFGASEYDFAIPVAATHAVH